MELRWIPILLGIGILVLLYYSGRPSARKRPRSGAARGQTQYPDAVSDDAASRQPLDYPEAGSADRAYEEHRGDLSQTDPAMGYAPAPHGAAPGAPGSDVQTSATAGDPGHGINEAPGAVHIDAGGMPAIETPATAVAHSAVAQNDRPVYPPDPYGQDMGYSQAPQYDPSRNSGRPRMPDPHDPYEKTLPVDAGYAAGDADLPPELRDPKTSLRSPQGNPAAQARSMISAKIDALTERLRGSQRQRPNEIPPRTTTSPVNSRNSKIIALHIVAPHGQVIHGPRLMSLFEQRGYHFGEMNIYHSLHEGKIVFSIAKMVKPGYFDLDDEHSFETPGVSMILQLPAPVAADIAFEVMISEAQEMADALGCTILDSERSNLSRQTVQHLRDSVHQFMHQQRLAEAVPS